MKRILSIIFLIIFQASFACDDITSPAPNPVVPPAQESSVPQEIKKPELTKEDLIETYNFIISVRNGIMEWKAKLDPLLKARDPYFSANRDEFRRWIGQQAVIIGIRDERISPVKNNLPKGHPAESLYSALQQLKYLMGSYVEHYYLGRPIKHQYEKNLRKWLDDFQERMKTYSFPETSAPQPKLQSGATP